MGSWCPLDSVIQNRSIENLTKVVAPINSNCNIEFDNDYIKKLLKGEIKMEVVKIEGNKAILTNGVATRIIDLEKDYMAEVDVIITDLEEKIKYYKSVKQNIYDDQKLILQYLLKLKGEKDEHNN